MHLKNIPIKHFLDALGACKKRAKFFTKFGRAWKKAFEAMTERDKDFLSDYISVDSFDAFRRDAEKLMKLYKKRGYVISKCGDKEWRQNGKTHRLDGPAVEWANGSKAWHQNGKLHRSDGPAIEYANGNKEWYQNDKIHRIGGPALEAADGGKHWCQNDKLHRIDGPAIEWPNGYKEYWIEGKLYSEQDYIAKVAKMKSALELPSCAGKIVTIDGKRYKLQEV